MQQLCSRWGRAGRLGLGLAAFGSALALAPATAAAAPSTTVIDSVSPVQRTMQPVTITATVSGSRPLTGTVELRNQLPASTRWGDRFRSLGSQRCPGTSSTCTVTVTAPTLVPRPEVNQIRARYLGDSANDPSESDPVAVEVDWATTTPKVSHVTHTTPFGQPVVVEAHLTLDAPSVWPTANGSQTLLTTLTDANTGWRVQAPAFLTSALALNVLPAEPHGLTVSWTDTAREPWPVRLPDPVPLKHTVVKASSNLALTSASAGGGTRLVARVSAVAPGAGIGTGEVTFTEGDAVLGRAPVGNDGVAVLEVPLSPGAHAVRATYSGDRNFHGTEAVLAVDVSRGDGGGGSAGGGGGGGSAGSVGQPAPSTQRGQLLGAAVKPDGTLVAHVRCVTGRVRVKAKRRGKPYASGSASCTGARTRLTLAPAADARRSGKVRVVASFSDGHAARLSVSAPTRKPVAAG